MFVCGMVARAEGIDQLVCWGLGLEGSPATFGGHNIWGHYLGSQYLGALLARHGGAAREWETVSLRVTLSLMV